MLFSEAFEEILKLAEQLVEAYERSCELVGRGSDCATLEGFRDDHLYSFLQLRRRAGAEEGARPLATGDASPSWSARETAPPMRGQLDAFSTLWSMEDQLVESLAEARSQGPPRELRELSSMMMEQARHHWAWLAVRVSEERMVRPIC